MSSRESRDRARIPKATNLLLTGVPAAGKTTVLLKVASHLTAEPLGGFLTSEIRVEGVRRGFRIESFAGRCETLAHVDATTGPAVGRYRVDLRALESVVDESLRPGCADIYLIDEIGKMECLSSKFVEAVRALLASRAIIVASVARHGGGLVSAVKSRHDVELWTVSRKNRDALPGRVLLWIEQARLAAGR